MKAGPEQRGPAVGGLFRGVGREGGMGGRDLKGSPYSRAPIARKGSSSKKLQFAEPDQQRPRPSPPARRSDGNPVGAGQRKEAGDPSPRKAKAVQAAPLLEKSRDHEFKRSMNNVQGYTENMLIRKSHEPAPGDFHSEISTTVSRFRRGPNAVMMTAERSPASVPKLALPGPGQYTIQEPKSAGGRMMAQSGGDPRVPIFIPDGGALTERVFMLSKKGLETGHPGPGEYSPARPQEHEYKAFISKAVRRNFVEDVMDKAAQEPGPLDFDWISHEKRSGADLGKTFERSVRKPAWETRRDAPAPWDYDTSGPFNMNKGPAKVTSAYDPKTLRRTMNFNARSDAPGPGAYDVAASSDLVHRHGGPKGATMTGKYRPLGIEHTHFHTQSSKTKARTLGGAYSNFDHVFSGAEAMRLVKMGTLATEEHGKKSMKLRADKAFAKAVERGRAHREQEESGDDEEDLNVIGSDVVPVVGLKVEYAKTYLWEKGVNQRRGRIEEVDKNSLLATVRWEELGPFEPPEVCRTGYDNDFWLSLSEDKPDQEAIDSEQQVLLKNCAAKPRYIVGADGVSRLISGKVPTYKRMGEKIVLKKACEPGSIVAEIKKQIAMEAKQAEYERQQHELSMLLKEKGGGGMTTSAGKSVLTSADTKGAKKQRALLSMQKRIAGKMSSVKKELHWRYKAMKAGNILATMGCDNDRSELIRLGKFVVMPDTNEANKRDLVNRVRNSLNAKLLQRLREGYEPYVPKSEWEEYDVNMRDRAGSGSSSSSLGVGFPWKLPDSRIGDQGGSTRGQGKVREVQDGETESASDGSRRGSSRGNLSVSGGGSSASRRVSRGGLDAGSGQGVVLSRGASKGDGDLRKSLSRDGVRPTNGHVSQSPAPSPRPSSQPSPLPGSRGGSTGGAGAGEASPRFTIGSRGASRGDGGASPRFTIGSRGAVDPLGESNQPRGGGIHRLHAGESEGLEEQSAAGGGFDMLDLDSDEGMELGAASNGAGEDSARGDQSSGSAVENSLVSRRRGSRGTLMSVTVKNQVEEEGALISPPFAAVPTPGGSSATFDPAKSISGQIRSPGSQEKASAFRRSSFSGVVESPTGSQRSSGRPMILSRQQSVAVLEQIMDNRDKELSELRPKDKASFKEKDDIFVRARSSVVDEEKRDEGQSEEDVFSRRRSFDEPTQVGGLLKAFMGNPVRERAPSISRSSFIMPQTTSVAPSDSVAHHVPLLFPAAIVQQEESERRSSLSLGGMMKVAGAMRKFQKGAAKRKWKKLKLEIQERVMKDLEMSDGSVTLEEIEEFHLKKTIFDNNLLEDEDFVAELAANGAALLEDSDSELEREEEEEEEQAQTSRTEDTPGKPESVLKVVSSIDFNKTRKKSVR